MAWLCPCGQWQGPCCGSGGPGDSAGCRHGVGCVCFRVLANTETYLKETALKHMPPNLQKVDLLRTGEQNICFTLFPRMKEDKYVDR